MTKTNGLDTYWIAEPTQIRCLAGARRHDIIDRLAHAGPLSVRELADWLGAKPSALYHHIQQLMAADLIRPAGHRTLNRRREQLYAARAHRMSLTQELKGAEVESGLAEVATAFSRQTERDFRRGVQASEAVAGGPHRNLAIERRFGRPSVETLVQVNALLDEVSSLMAADDDPSRPAVVVSWTLSPGMRPGD